MAKHYSLACPLLLNFLPESCLHSVLELSRPRFEVLNRLAFSECLENLVIIFVIYSHSSLFFCFFHLIDKFLKVLLSFKNLLHCLLLLLVELIGEGHNFV